MKGKVGLITSIADTSLLFEQNRKLMQAHNRSRDVLEVGFVQITMS